MRIAMRALILAFICSFALVRAQDFKKQVIYQIVTDRFYDGDTCLLYTSPSPRD